MAPQGEDKISEIKRRADIGEIVGEHVQLRRVGRNLVGLCPFHNEKTPSFNVNPERGFFYCFGCGVGGTVLDFVMRIEAVDFNEALQILARRYGVALSSGRASAASPTLKDQIFRANLLARDFFVHTLWRAPEGAAARSYLSQRRIAEKTARDCAIGFAPRGPATLAAILRKRGLFEAGLRAGLIVAREGGEVVDLFRSRIVFPIDDPVGNVIAFGGRALDDGKPKYLNSPESPVFVKRRALFGLGRAKRAISARGRALVVEGYFDAVALWQEGFEEVVATLGTALSTEHLRLLSRYANDIIACFDGDAAGRAASLRALRTFLDAGLQGKAVFLPAGMDPDEFIHQRGLQAFEQLVNSAEMLIDHYVMTEAANSRDSVLARARAAQRVAELLQIIKDPFEFDLLARRAAEMLAVDEQLLRARARHSPRRHRAEAGAANPGRFTSRRYEAELGLAAIALTYPALRPWLRQQLSTVEFERPELGSFVADVCALENEAFEPSRFIEERLTADERALMARLLTPGELIPNEEAGRAMAAEYLAAIERRAQRHKLQELARAAGGAQARGDSRAGEKLAQAVIELRRRERVK